MNSLKFVGNCVHVGNDVDTDAILPARYLSLSKQEDLGLHFMEDVAPGLVEKVEPGSILVAGSNFGCGSSREHAPVAIRGAGFSCVIAESFSRLFYRNAINIGLPVLIVENAKEIPVDSMLSVDCGSGIIRDTKTDAAFNSKPMNAFMLEILASGGLLPYLQREQGKS